MAGPAKLRRDAGVIGLLYASLGSIIGSGWLFGALDAAKQAGPMSVFSWIVGAIAILLIAFVFAELSTMFPNSGALVHMTHVSHGDCLGKIWSWILFLSFVSVAPVEVTAVLTYANNYLPGLIDSAGLLTGIGYVCAAALLAIAIGLNFLAVRWVMRINSAATWWKLAIPIATIAVLLIYSFHPSNMTASTEDLSAAGIFTAVSTAGIAFSYLGFQQVIALAGETRKPGRYIPIALIGSVLIGAVVYVGLQIAFTLALNPADLADGWANLHFEGHFGPLAAIAVAVGAMWWAIILYVDAFISPFGTGFIYATASPRITMAAGEMGDAPKVLTRLNRQGVPWVGLILAYVVGLIYFFPFPSWQKLVTAVVLITVLSYSIGPIILLALRSAMPDAKRPFRLRWPLVMAILGFISSNWIIYWTGTTTIEKMFGFVGAYIIVLLLWNLVQYLRGKCATALPQGWRQAVWLVPYLAGMWLISYFSPVAGIGKIVGGAYDFFTGMWIIAGFSIAILALAVFSRQNDEAIRATDNYVRTLGSRGAVSDEQAAENGREETKPSA